MGPVPLRVPLDRLSDAATMVVVVAAIEPDQWRWHGCGRLNRLSEIPSETEPGQADLRKHLFRKSRLPIADDSERWRWTHRYREEKAAAVLRHTPFLHDTGDVEQPPGCT